MKDRIIIGLLAVSIIFNIVNFYRSSCKTCAPVDTPKENKEQPKAADENAKPTMPFEVADVMTKLQRNMNKLWFAGSSQNWVLANFYVKELEEAEDVIAEQNVVDESYNLSQLMKVMGKPSIKELASTINAQDQAKFKEKYINVVNNCNACHASTKHEFLVIKQPTAPAYDNQDYGKK